MQVTVSRKAHFNAAHRLYRKDWTDQQNEAIYGKCANPHYHGHNYELIVHVTGAIDPNTGYVMDMKVLKDLIKAEVEDLLDHKNLNEQVADFFDLIPSAENIAVVIYNKLKPHLDKSHTLSVTLYETPRNFVNFSG
ncbi:MAG: 6-pyruvoyl trahydropterin synthase family protein [Flavobacteriales bacterium]|jgi:6-pyruvoyltetrahydropterin/6-carboxytetrahydropterin synthase|nr:6-carboxytetrahydropterin synthase [Flavobacteriaceae bacterium]|tara:strand:- start:165 stop:572 length:408 start_codon:yes stop_codon:yes gene_type:complete